jgi:hypothetical protein
MAKAENIRTSEYLIEKSLDVIANFIASKPLDPIDSKNLIKAVCLVQEASTKLSEARCIIEPIAADKRLYKARYCIAVYDMDDQPVVAVNNPAEMARFFGISTQMARDKVKRAFPGKSGRAESDTLVGKERYRLCFYDPED